MSLKNDVNGNRLPQLHPLSKPNGPLDLCRKLMKEMECKLEPKKDVGGLRKALT